MNPSVKETLDYFFEVGRGNVPGHSFINQSGENPDIDTASGFEDVWDGGGTYVAPTTARLHDIASTSANDAGTVVSSGIATGGTTVTIIDLAATFVTDGVAVGDNMLNDTNVQSGTVTEVTSETTLTMAGRMRNPNDGTDGLANQSGNAYRVVSNASTGTSVVHVLGNNISFLRQEEFVVLNGTSNVVTTKTWRRQYRARTFGPGATGAVGTISSTAQTDGTISFQILVGNNHTLMAIFTESLDKFGHLHKWWGSLSKKTGAISNLRLRAGTLGGVSFVIQSRSIDNSGKSDFDYKWPTPVPLPGGVDVWVEADTDTNNTGVSAGMDIISIDR